MATDEPKVVVTSAPRCWSLASLALKMKSGKHNAQKEDNSLSDSKRRRQMV